MEKRKVEDIKKIREKFQKEWVLLADYKFNKMNRLSRRRVIAHSKRRDDIYKEIMKHKEDLAIDYTGPIPKDLVVMFCG